MTIVSGLWATVPTLNQYSLLEKCLDALAGGEYVPEKVILVDNGGEYAGDDRGGWLQVVRPAKNLGVAASWNLAAAIAGDNDLLVLNDDLRVGQETVGKLITCLAPHVVANHSWSCFLWRASTRKVVGLFDERFYPAYYEDNDYARRLWLAGLAHAHVGDPDCRHAGSATAAARSDQHHQEFSENSARYSAKWGGPPGSERWHEPLWHVDQGQSPLAERLRRLTATPSDICEHLPLLASLARGYGSVIELGTRHGNSTTAFLAGGAMVQAVDCDPKPELAELVRLSCGRLRFIPGYSLDPELPIDPAAMLFIDTLHTEAQLRGELRLWAPLAQQAIVLHDTTTFGDNGEGGGPGLWPAVEEFIGDSGGAWRIGWRLSNCHGLTLIERRNPTGARY